MSTATTRTMTDAERVELQRACVAEHVALENAHELERVLEETFDHETAFYDIAPGLTHFEGMQGVRDFYEMLFTTLPDIHIEMTHCYDVPGCCVREGIVTGTHSAEFAGLPASGRRVSFCFAAMYLFGDDPTKLVAERAYWDNDGLFRQMRGEEAPTTGRPWDGSRL